MTRQRTTHSNRLKIFAAVLAACAVGAGAFVALRPGGSVPAQATSAAPTAVASEAPQPVTFSKDIAPLVFAKCGSCHHPGGVGPFSLLTYDDVASRARMIRRVTQSRFMPPWRPAAGYAEYANDRSLTADQVALIARWIDEGQALGDASAVPAAPVFTSGWQLGKPDLVVRLPAPYDLTADGTDVYRNFVIPRPVTEGHYVTAWEFSPGTRVIHHAIMNVDNYGFARRRDEEDPRPGFDGMDPGDTQSADGFYLVWTPGKVPTPPDPTAAFRLTPETDLVLQLHMQPSGKQETVNPEIALYFSDKPPTKPRFSLRVGDPPIIDIPAGEAHYVATADYVLPAAVDVITVFPHAHYVAAKVRTWATLPDGTERGLLKIDDWDFAWQDEYTFKEPVSLPQGTKITAEFVYDNSSANVRNPNNPPKRVKRGERSVDEMGNVTFQVVPQDPKGMSYLRESKYRRALEIEDTARNRYNLGNALGDMGKVDEAMDDYRRAIKLDPKLSLARNNLGILLMNAGKTDEAIAEFRAAVKAQPQVVRAYLNLGNALRTKNDLDGAIKVFRDAVAHDGDSALAHRSLGIALLAKGDRAGAIESLRKAVSLDPRDSRAKQELDKALGAGGASDDSR